MNETLKAIKNRRSIRKYKTEQIGDADLQSIMEAAIYAPSAMNQQKWHFTVIQDRETLAKIADMVKQTMLKSGIEFAVERAKSPGFNVFYEAPTVVLITADEQAISPELDCGAAAENIAVAAESLNIGSCVIGFTGFLFASEKADEIKKELGVPEGYKFIISVALGYKDVENPPVPPKNKDVINYIK
ncbi:NADPH-flavin oxidoreductase [subsurface metagenome]